jgi:Fic family protein
MIRSDTIEITPEIHALIARVDEFRRAWRAMGELAPEKRLPLRESATVEAIGASMRIEGSSITDAQVEHVLGMLSTDPSGSFSTSWEQEAAGYAQLIETIFSSWRNIPFTESSIKEMHRELLGQSEKDAWHRGRYKTMSPGSGDSNSDEIKEGADMRDVIPLETPRLMAELMGWLKEEQSAKHLHSLLIIALWVVVFLKIHPFQEGNGPLSRMLTTLLLLQSGYSYVQYSSLERIIEQNKEAYDLALRQTQETIGTGSPNWQPWLVFFLRSLAQQVTRLEQKIERKSEPRD